MTGKQQGVEYTAEQKTKDIEIVENLLTRLDEVCEGAGLTCLVAWTRPDLESDSATVDVHATGDIPSICVLKQHLDVKLMMVVAPQAFVEMVNGVLSVIDDEDDGEEESDEDFENRMTGDPVIKITDSTTPEDDIIPVPENYRDGHTPKNQLTCECGDTHDPTDCGKSVFSREDEDGFIHVMTPYTCPSCGATISTFDQKTALTRDDVE